MEKKFQALLLAPANERARLSFLTHHFTAMHNIIINNEKFNLEMVVTLLQMLDSKTQNAMQWHKDIYEMSHVGVDGIKSFGSWTVSAERTDDKVRQLDRVKH